MSVAGLDPAFNRKHRLVFRVFWMMKLIHSQRGFLRDGSRHTRFHHALKRPHNGAIAFAISGLFQALYRFEVTGHDLFLF